MLEHVREQRLAIVMCVRVKRCRDSQHPGGAGELSDGGREALCLPIDVIRLQGMR